MKFKKIVYIRYFPLTETIYNDLYFKELIEQKIEVEYLDISFLFSSNQTKSNSFDFKGNITIKNYNQLKEYFNKNNENTLYISIMSFEWRVIRLYRIITKYNLTIAVFARGVFPNAQISKKSKIKHLIKIVSFKKIILFSKSKLTSILKKTGFIKHYDYIFKAGNFGYWALGVGSEIDLLKSEIIDVNTVDYDRYLLEINKDNKSGDIVYLDQYFPYHPDVEFLKIKTVEPEIYYKELNVYFDRLEERTGRKIVIAAHPKAELYKQINPFNSRQIYFNQSDELVKDASLVITHDSTSICYPICFNKKILLLTSKYLENVFPYISLNMNGIKNACGASIVQMDVEKDMQFDKSIDKTLYQQYKYNYLTSKKSEKQISKDIFLNFILNKNK